MHPECRATVLWAGRVAQPPAVRRAREAGDVCGLRLYVERENERAKATYRKLGMRPTVYEMYETDFVLDRG